MKPDGTPLHGSYFELATAKYPDLQEPANSQQKRLVKRRSRHLGALPVVLVGSLAGVAWLVLALRPEQAVSLAPASAGVPRMTAEAMAPSPVSAGPASPAAAPVATLSAPPVTTPPASSVATPPAPSVATPPAPSVTPAPSPAAEETRPAPAANDPSVAEPEPERVRRGVADAVNALEAALPERPPAVEPVRQAGAPESEKPAPEPRETSVGGQTEPEIAAARVPDIDEPAASSPPTIARVQPPILIPARKVFAPAPQYPADASRTGKEGTVVVEASIDATGSVTEVAVVSGQSPALDAAAVAALETWRFEPARRDDVAVESTYRVGFTFAIQGEVTDPSAPLEVSDEVKPPRRLEAPLPAYPDAAWANGITGDVLVRAVIDATGAVTEVEVLKGLPHGMTEAAVEAIRRWKFEPATRGGQPVAVYRNLSVRFEG